MVKYFGGCVLRHDLGVCLYPFFNWCSSDPFYFFAANNSSDRMNIRKKAINKLQTFASGDLVLNVTNNFTMRELKSYYLIQYHWSMPTQNLYSKTSPLCKFILINWISFQFFVFWAVCPIFKGSTASTWRNCDSAMAGLFSIASLVATCGQLWCHKIEKIFYNDDGDDTMFWCPMSITCLDQDLYYLFYDFQCNQTIS